MGVTLVSRYATKQHFRYRQHGVLIDIVANLFKL